MNKSDFEENKIQVIYPNLNGLFPNEKGYNYGMEIFGKLCEQFQFYVYYSSVVVQSIKQQNAII